MNNWFLRYYSFGRRAILFVCILFQINMVRAQSTPDSTNLNDTLPAKTKQNDPAILRPAVRKPTKIPADTVAVFRTDTLRYSAKKPADYKHLPVDWSDLLRSESFFNFFGEAVHMRSEKFER